MNYFPITLIILILFFILKTRIIESFALKFIHIPKNAGTSIENIAKKKIVDYFQLNHPKFFLQGQFSRKSENYIIDLKKIIDLELTLQSFIQEKRVAMILKNNGLKRYKEALNKIKNLLKENLLNS